MSYSVIIPDETIVRAERYLSELRVDSSRAGKLLSARLSGVSLEDLTAEGLIGKLFETKKPQIFAEMDVFGDGTDWNLTELGLLGDVSVSLPVTVFDTGLHDNPVQHDEEFAGTLVYTAGALLRNGKGCEPADWAATFGRTVDFLGGYEELYRRRLLPVLRHINEQPGMALITIPGIGCGQFAGPYIGILGPCLEVALRKILDEFGDSLPNLKAVYYDPYNECANSRTDIHGIQFLVRPYTEFGNEKPQLCHPTDYEEDEDDFSDCNLYSIVAWDHVSWPGNDFFAGYRATDDGVKSAATDSMFALMGVEGNYSDGSYKPPEPYSTWGQVAYGKIAEGFKLF